MTVEKSEGETVKVITSEKLAISADKVWELIAGFDSLQDYHAAVERSVLEKAGTVRRLWLTAAAGGGIIVERLVFFDDAAREFSYKIIELIDCDLPFKDYVAKVKVQPLDGSSCEVHWSSEFTAVGLDEAGAAEVARAIYRGCYDGIRNKLAH